MRFINYLNEEYVTRVKGNYGTYSGDSEVFVNPTIKELGSLKNEVRFIINFILKRFYVWDWDVVHYQVSKKLNSDGLVPVIDYDKFWEFCYAGTAKRQDNKLKVTDISDFGRDLLFDPKEHRWLKYDRSWLKRWFKDTHFEDV